jgi:arabinoxylan arabinofuranohydrolase
MRMSGWTSTLLGTTLVLALVLAGCAASQTAATPTTKAIPTTTAAGFPAGYKGTPYKGVAQEIPGRVELENFDEGGLNVAFNTVHHEGDSSGKDYRPGAKPQICVTNGSPNEQDKFVDGKRYPAEGKESYYIGYARPGDWVKCTVNVKKAGVYRVNTTAANETKKMTFSLSFNDVKKADVTTDGTGSYHIWKVHENICTVKLDAGLQVMKFQLGSEPHMNYDYLEFVYDEKASAAAG